MKVATEREELLRDEGPEDAFGAGDFGAATSVAVFPFCFELVPRQIAIGSTGVVCYFGAFIVSNNRSITFSTLTPSASAR